MFSISENEISCFKINEIENDFIDIHVIMKLCFDIVRFKGQIKTYEYFDT